MEKSNLFDLTVDTEISGYLSETARWGKFLAICGFITCGFMILISFILNFVPFSPYGFGQSPAVPDQISETYNTSQAIGKTIGIVFYLVFGIVCIFPYVYLLKFSNRAKLALQSSDQDILISSFASLKSLFKFVGVLTIIMLSFIALGIVFAIIGSVMLATANA
ncbi:hypothetical protein [Chitinophaga barathri]|uniref:DUF5362 domain-containing protein n=1 Tax=Chitinophaga barathri TaxID=1647451 RepID=A0A3N4MLC5_9BACT|nr:hypothetical protein [Chitinophaga barathri]RPD42866.1 hypothetical protein EG028_00780 [Chitinophaga barathri]